MEYIGSEKKKRMFEGMDSKWKHREQTTKQSTSHKAQSIVKTTNNPITRMMTFRFEGSDKEEREEEEEERGRRKEKKEKKKKWRERTQKRNEEQEERRELRTVFAHR